MGYTGQCTTAGVQTICREAVFRCLGGHFPYWQVYIEGLPGESHFQAPSANYIGVVKCSVFFVKLKAHSGWC